MSVSIELLGGITVSVNGVPQQIASTRVRTMLALLALEPGRVITSDALIDELYGDQPPRNARNALQANATRVRKTIAGHLCEKAQLRSVPGGYVLDIQPFAVDVVRFADLVNRGTALAATDPTYAVDVFCRALTLWRGPALLGAGNGRRCQSEGVRLEKSRLMLWEKIVDLRIGLGQHEWAIAELYQLIARYPLHERFVEQLIFALLRVGGRSDALNAYWCAHRRLDEELGLRPGRELQRLYRAILVEDNEMLPPTAKCG